MLLLTSICAALLCIRGALATDVFAHFMMQYSFAYDQNQWLGDFAAAQQMGIDGFALNWLPPNCQSDLSWQVARMDDAYAIAQLMNFKLMLSFDMSYTQCNQFWNQTYMAQIISRYAGSSATYRWNSNILVSTFGGDNAPYGNQFLQGLKNLLASWNNAITLAPALTSYSYAAQTNPSTAASSLVSDYSSIDGYMNWQAWPLDVQSNLSASVDLAFQSQLRNSGKPGPYIMSISPWQYKDLNDDNVEDSWVQYSDYLFPHRWQSLVGPNAFKPDILEILTWNDWSESHYLRNLPSSSESATDFIELGQTGGYVDSMNHAPWRVIAKYYLTWMKTGNPPPISMDQVVFWYRTHPKDAVCLAGSSTTIRNKGLVTDAVFAWALVSAPATISMSVGSNAFWLFHADQTGPYMNMVPFPPEVFVGGSVTPEVAIIRNGAVQQVNKGVQPISSNCGYQNFNAAVVLVGPGVNHG